MKQKTKPHSYQFSVEKRLFDLLVAILALVISLPIFILVVTLIKLTSKSPAFFIQKRTGLRGKPFRIIKFRTMKTGAEELQIKLNKFNEVDGPVFKIRNDPRLTKFGKILSNTGLYELPQLINVIRGEMSLVGPRPLPVYEAKKLNQRNNRRTFPNNEG